MEYEPAAKLIQSCIKNNSDLVVRCIFWLNGLLKSCAISFNFYINQHWLFDRAHTHHERVFRSFDAVVEWGNLNKLASFLGSQKQVEKEGAMRELYMGNQIDIIQFVAEGNEHTVSTEKVRNYSPFYSMLEQGLSLTEGLFFLLEFLKTDREGKFDIKDSVETIELLEYYLFVSYRLCRRSACGRIGTSTARDCRLPSSTCWGGSLSTSTGTTTTTGTRRSSSACRRWLCAS